MLRLSRSWRSQVRPGVSDFVLSPLSSSTSTVSWKTSASHVVSPPAAHRHTQTALTESKRFTSNKGTGRIHSGISSDKKAQPPSAPGAALEVSRDTHNAQCEEDGLPISLRSTKMAPNLSSLRQAHAGFALGNTDSAAQSSSTATALRACFSQGLTDFCWRESHAKQGVSEPSVQHSQSVKNRIRLFGMPKGFPDSTADGFRRFFFLSQANSFIADFSACIGYQSLLSGFFLGSSPQMWMLKDLFPALIAAYMANRLVSYESRPKQWFCVSVLLRNVTIVFDMIIPSALPQHMVLAAVVNAVLKQSSALMFFITRAAALQHYATDNNLAELTKKFNSFSMVTFTFATALAIVYCTFLTSFTAQLTTILVCCVANLALSFMAMNPIAFRVLNFSTIQLLLQAYIMKAGHIMTPQEVSDVMGIRMSAACAMQDCGAGADVAKHLLYISPPIDKLLICSDTLDKDVLYVDVKGAFLLALWRPSAAPLTLQECWHRYELPSLPRILRDKLTWGGRRSALAAMEKRFNGNRLCLLVHHKCTAKDLATAYLIMYTAALQHATTEEELRAFVRQCNTEQDAWQARGDCLCQELERVKWDVQRPALDHHDFRFSQLPVQPAADNVCPPSTSVL